ncbi:MAG: DUF6152 family protein [Arenicellaceae bacterium]|nr:DUF6152 family protein [Arenicellaceae bacterium]
MNVNLRLVITGLLLVLPLSVFSHHSNSEFDQSVDTEFEGKVVQVLWRNPHILIDVATTDESGVETVWHLEGSAVSAQHRQGVEAGLIQEGQQVRIAGWASTRRDKHLLVNHVLLPDSVELLVGNVREPRWSQTGLGEERFMGLAASPEQPLDESLGEAERLFRVWVRATGSWYFKGADAYQLTEQALVAKAAWNEFEDNPLLNCTPPGMPAVMGNPYPMQFVQLDDTIELRFEEFDAVRTIHLDDAAVVAQQPLSHLGYSVGHWEENTLVVKTNRINWPYFDRVGVPQSDAVEVVERFTAVDVDNQDKLIYRLTISDPATLNEPFTWNGEFVGKDGEVVERYECVLEESVAQNTPQP